MQGGVRGYLLYLGAERTSTTIKYLRLAYDDLNGAMVKYYDITKNLRGPKIGHFDNSQMRSGQGGI